MIDEKKLIMEIANWQESLLPHNDIQDKLIYAVLESIIETVNSQPKVGEWTPCSENLPKVKGHYLVTISDSDGEHVDTHNFDPAYPRDLEIWRSGKIVAWKPKPEPWKGNEHAERKANKMEVENE